MHSYKGLPSAEELALMKERIHAFIAPNIARTEYEKQKVEEAAILQYQFEMSMQQGYGDMPMPAGTKMFRIGNFWMQFDGTKNSAVLHKENMSPYAYSILFNAGLLYRGVL